jgi:hypothetical protein
MSDDDSARKDRWHRIHAAFNRALKDATLPVDDRTTIAGFVNDEIPQFQQNGVTTYLVFGSYRGTYEPRLRALQYELSKPSDAAAVLIGDAPDIDLDISSPTADPLGFLIKFHLLGEFADYLVGVYEKESGGESPELGLLHNRPYFEKGYMFPRDYQSLLSDGLETPSDVITTATQIRFANDIDNDTKLQKLRALLSEAGTNGIEISETELVEAMEERERDGMEDTAQYSWVHLSLFRLYELHSRCFSWHTESELRERARVVPGPARPAWEEGNEFDGSLD